MCFKSRYRDDEAVLDVVPRRWFVERVMVSVPSFTSTGVVSVVSARVAAHETGDVSGLLVVFDAALMWPSLTAD